VLINISLKRRAHDAESTVQSDMKLVEELERTTKEHSRQAAKGEAKYHSEIVQKERKPD